MRQPKPIRSALADGGRFLKGLLRDPRRAGAIAPSGLGLARTMAKAAGKPDGVVIELGPGTGPVTAALLEAGLKPDRLALVEYDAQFCRLLSERFPMLRVIQGDAFRLGDTLRPLNGARIGAVVSSLPLLNEPPVARARLLEDAFSLMGETGVFVQFTYGLNPPIPREMAHGRYVVRRFATIWRNLPPAHVWTYRRAEG
jgi:phosphatidylethanolamine/phosphatidyl-N-methylethanolamine N-methyltransferase